MKVNDIIFEEASEGSTSSALFASVVFPMTPGTKPADARAAVDPMGYTVNKRSKKKRIPGYPKVIRRIYPNE